MAKRGQESLSARAMFEGENGGGGDSFDSKHIKRDSQRIPTNLFEYTEFQKCLRISDKHRFGKCIMTSPTGVTMLLGNALELLPSNSEKRMKDRKKEREQERKKKETRAEKG